MKLPINAIGESYRAAVKKIKRTLSELGENFNKSEAIQQLKAVWSSFNLNDSKFKLLQVAFDEGFTYATMKGFNEGVVNKLYRKANVKKEDSHKFSISLNIERLSKMSEVTLKGYLQRKLASADFPTTHFDAPVSMKVLNKLDIPVNLEAYQGMPLIEALVKVIKSQEPTKSKELPKSNKEHDDKSLEEKISNAEKENPAKDRESVIAYLEAACENTDDINLAGSLKLEEIAYLFVDREALLEAFGVLIVQFNDLMNQVKGGKLPPNKVQEIENNLDPFVDNVDSLASTCGADGDRVTNIANDLRNKFQNECKNEGTKEEDNDILKQASDEQNNLKEEIGPEGNPYEDGIDNPSTATGAVNELVGTSGVNGLSPKNARLKEKYKIYGDTDESVENALVELARMGILDKEDGLELGLSIDD